MGITFPSVLGCPSDKPTFNKFLLIYYFFIMFGGRKSQWTLYSSDLNIIKLFANDIKIEKKSIYLFLYL
jgi:hypothetical protein